MVGIMAVGSMAVNEHMPRSAPTKQKIAFKKIIPIQTHPVCSRTTHCRIYIEDQPEYYFYTSILFYVVSHSSGTLRINVQGVIRHFF